MFVVPLPDSVQQSLDRICQVRKQPQPDDGIRSMLASLSEQEALSLLEGIDRTKTKIKTLNGYIAWMIKNRLKTESSSSSSSSTTTLLMPNSPPASSSSSVYQTPLSPCASSSVTSPDRSLGETVSYGSPILEQHQDYNRQPHYSSYRSHSGFQPQGESSNPSPATLCNDQSPSSSLSTYQILSAPSEIYRRLCQGFQGISSFLFQTSSASPVTPVQLHKSFQGDHGPAHLKALEELQFRRRFIILSYAGRTKLKDVIDEEDIRGWKNLPMVEFENTVWHVLGENNVSKADRRMFTDWDSQRTHYYHCYVSMDGSYQFKGPYLDKTRTLLHKFGDDNILEIKFTQGEGSSTVFDKKNVHTAS